MFSFNSSLPIILWFIVGQYQTSNAKIIPHINTSSSQEKEDSSGRIELNSIFTLHVLVGALCLFLFAILIQLCRKSKTKKVKVCDIQNECQVQTQPGNRHSYDTVTESVATVQTYRHLESEYDEVDEKVQVHTSSSLKTFSDNYEEPEIATGTSSPMHGASDLRVPLNEENTKQLGLSANISNCIDLEIKRLGRNVYIEVINTDFTNL